MGKGSNGMKTDLKVLSDAELVGRFNELAVQMGEDCQNFATRSYNRRATQMRAVDDELFYRGKLDALLPGMQSENLWIQYFSATHCRSIAPAEVMVVLERLNQLDRPGTNTFPGSVAGEAWTSLNIIRSGRAVERIRSPRE